MGRNWDFAPYDDPWLATDDDERKRREERLEKEKNRKLIRDIFGAVQERKIKENQQIQSADISTEEIFTFVGILVVFALSFVMLQNKFTGKKFGARRRKNKKN